MAEINKPIIYNETIIDKINEIKESKDFSHHSWADEGLESFRSEVREYYRVEQNGFCAFCKKDISLIAAANCQVEHIVPKSKHLKYMFTEKNLCVICADCNQIKREQETLGEIPETIKNAEKRVIYPKSSSAFLIVHPHFDNYEDHIEIHNKHYYFDKTDKGHFTIGACKLNRRLRKFGVEESIIEDDEISQLTYELLSCNDHSKRIKLISKIGYLESLKEV